MNEAFSRALVLDTVKRLLIRESRVAVSPAQVADDEPLVGPLLRVNSLGFVGMLVALEDELGVSLPDDVFVGHAFTTVTDVVDVITGCAR